MAFDKDIKERNLTVLFEFSGEFDINMSAIEI